MNKPSHKIPGNALTFLPRVLDRFFAELSERTFAGKKEFFCYRRGVEGFNLQREFYRYFRRPALCTVLTEEDYRQIIFRDRVLRRLPRERATRMVDAMYHVLDQLTGRSRPDYVLSVLVDHYMTDVLARMCRQKGIRLVMGGAGSLPNTITVTAYGEFNKVREPGDDEADRAVAKLTDDNTRITYASPFRGYSPSRHLASCCRWWAKRFYFAGLSLLTRDPLNYRHLCGTLPGITGPSAWSGFRCARFFDLDWESKLASSDRPPLLMPLGHTPEATTDYWLRDLRYVDYEAFVLQAARALSASYQVMIKEHWSCLGQRPWRFYEQLKSIPGVVLVPAGVNSRLVMQHVDRVLVGAGTAGVEAALRGKKVATLDRPYYHLDGCYLNLMSADRIAELPARLEQFRWLPKTRDTQRAVVRRMLEATIRGCSVPGPVLNTEENFHTASESLKAYLDVNPLAISGQWPPSRAA